MAMPKPGKVILMIAALQFVYILDFMMVLPLGPDLTKALGFPADHLGWLSLAYTLASVLSGLAGMAILDRHGRKPALLVAIGGFGLATLASVWCDGLTSLLWARALAGFFGGPMVALGMAMVIDATPPDKRGQAIGQVMTGFSIAAIAGVPLALELARWGGWTAPFLALTACSAWLWVAVSALLPGTVGHAQARTGGASLAGLLAQPAVRRACALQAASQFSAFLLIPSFAAFYVLNLGVPRSELGGLYLAGGLAAFAALQLLGRLGDRFGTLPAVALASLAMVAGLVPFLSGSASPVWLPFMLFMAGNAGRNVALAGATSQVPAPSERAGFMALQSVVQDVAIALAAGLSSLLLTTSPSGTLLGMGPIACMAIGGIWVVVWLSGSLTGRRHPVPFDAPSGP